MTGPPTSLLAALLRQLPAFGSGASHLPQIDHPVGADWKALLPLASAQKVAPLLASLLSVPSVASSVPPEVVAELDGIRRRTAMRVLLQLAELQRVTAALAAAGIRTLVFKGPLLAQQAYGDAALRQCFDLDLFLPERQVLEAKKVLLQLGYRPEFTFQPHEEADLLKVECEYPFIHAQNGVRLDVQWRPRARYFSFPVPAQALWERAIKVELNGRPTETFALEDLVLYLIAHGAKHTWHRLEQVAALAGLLHRNPALDWKAVETAARTAGAERMLFVAVRLATEHFHAPVPAALVERAAKDTEALALAEEFARQWTANPEAPSLFTTLRLHLRLRERWLDRARHCFWLAFTPSPEDWLNCPLPARWHWLHYVRRPWRLLKKYLPLGTRAV